VVVELVQSRVESVEGLFGQNVSAGDVAEVEERVESLDDIRVYEALKCGDKYLTGNGQPTKRT